MTEILVRIVRTTMPAFWAWLSLWLFRLAGITFNAEQNATIEQALVIVGVAGVTALIAVLSKKFPLVELLQGWWKAPVYVRPRNRARAARIIKDQRL